jgi:hypothetical protein
VGQYTGQNLAQSLPGKLKPCTVLASGILHRVVDQISALHDQTARGLIEPGTLLLLKHAAGLGEERVDLRILIPGGGFSSTIGESYISPIQFSGSTKCVLTQ